MTGLLETCASHGNVLEPLKVIISYVTSFFVDTVGCSLLATFHMHGIYIIFYVGHILVPYYYLCWYKLNDDGI